MSTEQTRDADVSVPRGLLDKVLNAAETNLWHVHGESCISSDVDADGRHVCDKEQEAIDALRAAAGLGAGLGSIVAEFVCSPECPTCQGCGTVCEAHPDRAWGPMIAAAPYPPAEVGPMGECWCGAPGMPCGAIAKAREALA